ARVISHTGIEYLLRDRGPRTGRDDHLVRGDHLTGSGVDAALADEPRVTVVDGDVRAVLAAVALTARSDGIDAAEDPVDDVVPPHPVDRRVDAVLRSGADRVGDLRGVDVHLRGDAAHVEAGAPEGAFFEEGDALPVVPLVEDRVPRSCADDREVVVGHACSPMGRCSTETVAEPAESSAGSGAEVSALPAPSNHSSHRSNSRKASARGPGVDRNTSCRAPSIGTIVVRLPRHPAHRAIWRTSRTASTVSTLASYFGAEREAPDRRISDGTPMSSPRCRTAWPRRTARNQPNRTGKPVRGFQSRS